MTDIALTSAVRPAPLPVGQILPWAVFGGLVLLIALYFVGVAQGEYLHEFVHDGRHLLGFPCH